MSKSWFWEQHFFSPNMYAHTVAAAHSVDAASIVKDLKIQF